MSEKLRDKRVWILGAGFSRHAGGPLLSDLFSEGSDELFPSVDDEWGPKLRDVGTIYRNHSGKEGLKLWSDPEQFMERLDNYLFANGTLVNILKDRKIRALKELQLLTKIRFCAEVQKPLTGFDPESDRGSPYIHWMKNLEARDVLITFNYDLLIEKAAREAERCLNKVGPNWSDDELPKSPEWPMLLKLHGSVDWFQREDGTIGRCDTGDDYMNFPISNRVPLIGTPGNAKGQMKKMMDDSWRRAAESINFARSIHIVGYRFPQSDSNSVLALAKQMVREDCDVNIVLGKGDGNPDVERIRNLLKYVAGNEFARIVDLYAQDYMCADAYWTHDSDAARVELI
jgi:hypothetical protein